MPTQQPLYTIFPNSPAATTVPLLLLLPTPTRSRLEAPHEAARPLPPLNREDDVPDRTKRHHGYPRGLPGHPLHCNPSSVPHRLSQCLSITDTATLAGFSTLGTTAYFSGTTHFIRKSLMRPKLLLIRGLPGYGKSTLARQRALGQGYVHLETDLFFTDGDGHYHFDPTLLPEAHKWCQDQTENSMKAGKNVVVSNTFSQFWEMQPYFKLAATYGYDATVITTTGDFKSTHNVPEHVIQQMRDRWEGFPE